MDFELVIVPNKAYKVLSAREKRKMGLGLALKGLWITGEERQ